MEYINFSKDNILKPLYGTVKHFSDDEIANITAKGFTDNTFAFRILKKYFDGMGLASQEYFVIELNKNHPIIEINSEPTDKCFFWIDEFDKNHLYYKLDNNGFEEISYISSNQKLRNIIANNPNLFTIKKNFYGKNLYEEYLQKLPHQYIQPENV